MPTEPSIAIPPSDDICRLADIIDQFVAESLAATRSPNRLLGKYESQSEAGALWLAIVRHTESVAMLGRTDLAHYPSAAACARAAFEAHALMRWLIHPSEPMDQEVRWVQHVRDSIRNMRSIDGIPNIPDQLKLTAKRRANELEHRADAIAGLLAEKGIAGLENKFPKFRHMLKSIGLEHLYLYYKVLCAPTHSTHEGLSIYRRGFGTGAQWGEYIQQSTWHLPFEVAWKSLWHSTESLLQLLDSSARMADMKALDDGFLSTLGRIRNGGER